PPTTPLFPYTTLFRSPVHDVTERGQHVPADRAPHGLVGEEPRVDEDEAQHEEERREQPPGAAAVEGERVDRPGAHPLLHQLAGRSEEHTSELQSRFDL